MYPHGCISISTGLWQQPNSIMQSQSLPCLISLLVILLDTPAQTQLLRTSLHLGRLLDPTIKPELSKWLFCIKSAQQSVHSANYEATI